MAQKMEHRASVDRFDVKGGDCDNFHSLRDSSVSSRLPAASGEGKERGGISMTRLAALCQMKGRSHISATKLFPEKIV